MNIIEKFLQAEINEQELYEVIVEFIESYEIRRATKSFQIAFFLFIPLYK